MPAYIPENDSTLNEALDELHGRFDDGNFRDIAERYPQFITEIFNAMIRYSTPTLADVRFLQERGLDLNSHENPLHTACEVRKSERIRVLLEAGANPNILCNFDDLHQGLTYTPIESVLIGQHQDDDYYYGDAGECIRILIEFGAEIRRNADLLLQTAIAEFKKPQDEWDDDKFDDDKYHIGPLNPWNPYLNEICSQI